MNKELDGIRALLRDSVFVGILGLGLLFACFLVILVRNNP